MPLGPLIYFYVQTSTGSPFSFQKDKIHFAPVILDLVPLIVSLVGITYYLLGIHSNIETVNLGNFKEAYEKYVDIPRWISLTVYIIMATKLVISKQIQGKRIAWVRQFLIGFALFQLFWLFHLIPYLIPSSTSWLLGTLSWYPVYLPLTILVYWLGINGVIQSKSGASLLLNDADMKETIHILNQLMEAEKLYLDSKFSLASLVEKTKINQKNISAALNQYLRKTFNEYVNGFRVDEVKIRMNDPKYDHLSITGIAFDCGFNSQATFQRSFKSMTKMTPKAFQESIKKEIKSSHS